MKILVFKPFSDPEIRDIEGTLESMQTVVGGSIEPVCHWRDPVALVCNEEGKLLNLTPNVILTDSNGKEYDMIAGTFFLCGLGEEDFISLDDTLIEKYTNLFRSRRDQTYGNEGILSLLPSLPTSF